MNPTKPVECEQQKPVVVNWGLAFIEEKKKKSVNMNSVFFMVVDLHQMCIFNHEEQDY